MVECLPGMHKALSSTRNRTERRRGTGHVAQWQNAFLLYEILGSVSSTVEREGRKGQEAGEAREGEGTGRRRGEKGREGREIKPQDNIRLTGPRRRDRVQ